MILTYRWYEGGRELPGETAPILAQAGRLLFQGQRRVREYICEVFYRDSEWEVEESLPPARSQPLRISELNKPLLFSFWLPAIMVRRKCDAW